MRLVAAGTAAIVAIGLLSGPTSTNVTVVRAEHVLAVRQHQVEFTSISQPTKAPVSATKTAQANITLPQIEGAVTTVVLGAGVIALVPVWYAATPITLPASIFVSAFLYTWLSAIGVVIKLPAGVPAPLFVVGLGLAGWAAGPLYVANEAVKSVSRYLNSLLSQPDPAAATTSTSRAPRHAQRVTSGVAGSRRTAGSSVDADQKATTHRSAKTTPKPSTKKTRAGTANSARAARN